MGNVMSSDETAPDPTGEGASAAAMTAYDKALLQLKEKNSKVFTRLLLATSECPEGLSSPAAHTIAASHQGHLLLNALSTKPYGSFKSHIQCEMMHSGSNGMHFAEIARQATQFHATQVRGKSPIWMKHRGATAGR